MQTEELIKSKMNRSIMVCLQAENNKILNVSKQLLKKAEELAYELECEISAAFLGIYDENIRNIAADVSVVRLYFADEDISSFKDDVVSEYFLDCIKKENPNIVLVGTSPEGKTIASYAAAALETGLTADCTELKIENGKLIQTRPAYGGKIMADIVTNSKTCSIVTVREGALGKDRNYCEKNQDAEEQTSAYSAKKHAKKNTEIITVCIKKSSKIKITEERKLSYENPLKRAKKILAIGGGIKKKEDISFFEKIAEENGFELASSKSLVEKGWMPQSRQIGLSGQSVSPDLLVCFGISGSVQFCVGIRNAGKIVAVNIDESAGIASVCDEFCKADIYEIAENY